MELWQTKTFSFFNGRKRGTDISKIQGDDVGRFQAAFFATGAIKLKDGENEGGKGMPKVVFNESLVGSSGRLSASLKTDFLDWLKSKTDHVTLVGAAVETEDNDDAADALELERVNKEAEHSRASMQTMAKQALELAKQRRDQLAAAERAMRDNLETRAREVRAEAAMLSTTACEGESPLVAPAPEPTAARSLVVQYGGGAPPPTPYPAIITNYNTQPYHHHPVIVPADGYGGQQQPYYPQPLPVFRPPPPPFAAVVGGRGQPAPHHPRLPPPPRSSIGEAATRIADVGSSIGTIISALLSPNHCRAERRK